MRAASTPKPITIPYFLPYQSYLKPDRPAARNIPLIKPETQLTDLLGLEEFHSVEAVLSVLSYNQENGIWRALHNQKVLCEVTVRYSDDDFFESDEKRKKIYLVNLNFGYRRSRRNNKNIRKYRNRY